MAASFSAPASKLLFEKSTFLQRKRFHEKYITRKYFNYELQLILPGCKDVPGELLSKLGQETYWLVRELPLCQLIDKEFIEAFVKKGKIYMLSYRTHIDTENFVALLPTGVLMLHVDKDTYEELGLDAEPSRFGIKRKPSKYIIKVDLTKPYFAPGKKNYDRVRWCLTERLGLKMDFLFTWVPPEPSICPSSLAAYFKSHDLNTTAYSLARHAHKVRRIKCPVLNSKQTAESTESCGFQDFWEWLGALTLGFNCEEAAPDNYLSTLTCPEPSTSLEVCAFSHHRGLISPQCLLHILETIRQHMVSTGMPWAALTVHGFQDNPVTWDTWEHGFHSSGDNIYTFVIFPNQDYWFYRAFGSDDYCS